MTLSEVEKQILIGIRHLSPKYQPSRQKLYEVRESIFDEELLGWGDYLDALIKRGAVVETDGQLTINSSIVDEVEQFYQKWMMDGFCDILVRCEHSATYSEFCRRIYGADLCQFNMMTMPQLDKLLEVLKLDRDSKVLDLGCGIGTTTEYISDITAAHIVGIDFAEKAIARAQERTKLKRANLTFEVQNMDTLSFPDESFDTILAIDTLYFVKDLDSLIRKCKKLLNSGGQMGIFYSVMMEEGQSSDSLQPEENRLAKPLDTNGFKYTFWDYSKEHEDFWRSSKSIAEELKSEFNAEGNAKIYKGRIQESTRMLKYVEAGETRRYLYHARKGWEINES